jgi:hypothetical protein
MEPPFPISIVGVYTGKIRPWPPPNRTDEHHGSEMERALVSRTLRQPGLVIEGFFGCQ